MAVCPCCTANGFFLLRFFGGLKSIPVARTVVPMVRLVGGNSGMGAHLQGKFVTLICFRQFVLIYSNRKFYFFPSSKSNFFRNR